MATVLFDVDGTLVDSNYFHVVAWRRAFRRDGRSVAAADIHRLIGMGADQMLPILAGTASERLEDLWHEEFLTLRDEIEPTDGARDLVRAVAERRGTVVFATSGKAEDVEALRSVVGADRWVDEVVSQRRRPEQTCAGHLRARAPTSAGRPGDIDRHR